MKAVFLYYPFFVILIIIIIIISYTIILYPYRRRLRGIIYVFPLISISTHIPIALQQHNI